MAASHVCRQDARGPLHISGLPKRGTLTPVAVPLDLFPQEYFALELISFWNLQSMSMLGKAKKTCFPNAVSLKLLFECRSNFNWKDSLHIILILFKIKCTRKQPFFTLCPGWISSYFNQHILKALYYIKKCLNSSSKMKLNHSMYFLKFKFPLIEHQFHVMSLSFVENSTTQKHPLAKFIGSGFARFWPPCSLSTTLWSLWDPTTERDREKTCPNLVPSPVHPHPRPRDPPPSTRETFASPRPYPVYPSTASRPHLTVILWASRRLCLARLPQRKTPAEMASSDPEDQDSINGDNANEDEVIIVHEVTCSLLLELTRRYRFLEIIWFWRWRLRFWERGCWTRLAMD